LTFTLTCTAPLRLGAHGGRQDDATQYGDPDPNELMLEFIASGRLHVAPLLTHICPASKAEAAYNGLLNEKERYLGVLLDLQRWD
jgi:threonine dehydrogenase-like Zn-dependent dehydrogenase